jgi:hypothetical protein
MEDEEKCTCETEEIEEHECPYAMEIGGEDDLPEDERTMCSCCHYCETECRMNI